MENNDWKEYRLKDIILFNPQESVKKGTKIKKISMDKLLPYTRKISGYEEVEFTSGSKFRNGDTLLSRITPCLENGKTAQVDILNENEIAFGSTEFIVLREIHQKTVNDFIYYLAISNEFRDIAVKSMTGTSGRQRAQKDHIENAKFLIPPIEEQEAIAHVLYTLDEKIEVNNRINEILENMAQELFKRWFVDFEFPNENGEPYKSSGGEMVDSELGPIPKDWEIKLLSEIVDIKYGKNLPTNKLTTNGYPVFGGNGEIGFYNEFIYEDPQVLVACRGAASGKVLTSLPYSFVTNNSLVLENNKKIVTYEYLKYYCYKNQFYQYKTGSAQPQITIANIQNINCYIPKLEIAQYFTKYIKSLNIKQLKMFYENKILKNIREILLPKLMSGEIRLKELKNNE